MKKKERKKIKENILSLWAIPEQAADQSWLMDSSLLISDNDKSERTGVYEFGNVGYLWL